MGGWGGGEVATRYVERKKRKRWQPGTEALCSLRQGRSRRRSVERYVKRKQRERQKGGSDAGVQDLERNSTMLFFSSFCTLQLCHTSLSLCPASSCFFFFLLRREGSAAL